MFGDLFLFILLHYSFFFAEEEDIDEVDLEYLSPTEIAANASTKSAKPGYLLAAGGDSSSSAKSHPSFRCFYTRTCVRVTLVHQCICRLLTLYTRHTVTPSHRHTAPHRHSTGVVDVALRFYNGKGGASSISQEEFTLWRSQGPWHRQQPQTKVINMGPVRGAKVHPNPPACMPSRGH